METLLGGQAKTKTPLLNTFDYSFSDLVDISDLQQLIDQLSELAGCPIAILDADNTFLASAGLQKICTCFHRVHPETKKHCTESDCLIRQNLETENPIAYKCKNGLWDVAYPIVIEGKHVANIFFGQFFFDDEKIDVSYFEKQALKYGFDRTEYLRYLHEAPVISRKKAETLKNFSSTIALILTKTGYSNLLLKKEKIEEIRAANQQLEASELKFRKLFEQAGVGVVQVDVSSGMFINVNKKFADMLGYTIDEVLRLTFKDITYQADLIISKQAQDQLLKKQINEFSVEKRYVRKDGSAFWALLTATSMEEMPGGNQYQIAIVQDITERKKAETSLKQDNERFHTAMDAIDSVVYVADMENHEILFINKYVKNLFGDITGKKCYSALQGKTAPCDFCTNHLLLDVNGKANRPYIWEFQNLITKSWYQCHDQAIRWTNGKLVRFEMATDITLNKETENTLLENQIKLEELILTKDKLFSIIGHDLKNPFAVLLGASKLLLTYVEKNDLAKVESKAKMIHNASKQGHSLLENLLEWGRAQTGIIKCTPAYMNLKDKVSRSVRDVEGQAKNKNIIVSNEVPHDFYIVADENLLNVVFRNLLSNAIKFTHINGSVTIKAQMNGEMAEVSVIDTGIGIPKEHQDKLFRIDTNYQRKGTAEEESTSLGLILCKEFIEKHGGKIWVESEENMGSEFKFIIPVTNQSAQPLMI